MATGGNTYATLNMGSHMPGTAARPHLTGQQVESPRERSGYLRLQKEAPGPGVRHVGSVIRRFQFKSWFHPPNKCVALGNFLPLCASVFSSLGKDMGIMRDLLQRAVQTG